MRARRSVSPARPTLRSRLAPSPAVIVAALALVFALTGAAVAGNKINKDEVTVVTATGSDEKVVGPHKEGPGFSEEEIPLSIDSYTHRAGESVLLNATARIEQTSLPNVGGPECDVRVVVHMSDPGHEGGGDTGAGLEMLWLTERGDPGDATDSEGLPAPATDTERSLTALVSVAPYDGPDAIEDACDETDEFTVSVRVSIVTLRN
jgi:hypothetical protein